MWVFGHEDGRGGLHRESEFALAVAVAVTTAADTAAAASSLAPMPAAASVSSSSSAVPSTVTSAVASAVAMMDFRRVNVKNLLGEGIACAVPAHFELKPKHDNQQHKVNNSVLDGMHEAKHGHEEVKQASTHAPRQAPALH